MNDMVHSSTVGRRQIWTVGPVLLVVLCAVILGSCGRSRRVPVYAVRRGALVQTLVVSGRVMPPVRVNIGSLAMGTVARRLVEDGTRVEAGQVLLQLDDREARAAVAQARASVSQLNARLDMLHAVTTPVASETVSQASITLQRAERELQRLQALAADGIITASQLDDGRKAVDLARSQHLAARAQLASSQPSGADERVARATLDQAGAALAAAETKLDQLTIRAPAAGTIISRRVEAGDIVQPGQTLLVLAVDGPTLLTANPDEKNLPAIQMGQAAKASADAYPGETFPATVSFIGASVDPDRGTVEIRLTVPTPPPSLRPDMTVSVELSSARHEAALTVPADALRDATGRAPWVLAVSDGAVQRREVRVGLRGDAVVELVGGVKEGDLVIPVSAGTPAPGTKVSTTLREQ